MSLARPGQWDACSLLECLNEKVQLVSICQKLMDRTLAELQVTRKLKYWDYQLDMREDTRITDDECGRSTTGLRELTVRVFTRKG